MDLWGQIIFKLRFRHPFAYEEAYFRKLGDVVQQLIEEVRLEPDAVLGVGIGVPGLVTADGDTVFYGGILNFTGATRKELARYIEFLTILFNDAKAAAFAETWKNKNIDNAFYVMLSNNVGAHLYPYCFPFVIDHIYDGSLKTDGVVSSTYALENWEEAFEKATGKDGDFKAVFQF